MPGCSVCGATHTGTCRMESRAYFVCGEGGHMARDYLHWSIQSSRGVAPGTSSSIPSLSVASMRPPFDQGGKG